MKQLIALLMTAALLGACATRAPESQVSELYPYPPGSMGNPNAQATLLTGVTVLLLTAVFLHSVRDN